MSWAGGFGPTESGRQGESRGSGQRGRAQPRRGDGERRGRGLAWHWGRGVGVRPAEGRSAGAVATCAGTEVKVAGAKLEGREVARTASQWPIPSGLARPGCVAHPWSAAVPGPYCAGGRVPPAP